MSKCCRVTPKEYYTPFKPEVNDHKKFETLNKFVRARNGWITSIPGRRT